MISDLVREGKLNGNAQELLSSEKNDRCAWLRVAAKLIWFRLSSLSSI